MSPRKVPITLTYQKQGTHPPVFVAASFSDPAWQPQEMNTTIDQHGQHLFTKEAMVEEGSQIQYKFRIGHGDWWALDPKADTVNDALGNTNSIIRLPAVAHQDSPQTENPHVAKTNEEIPQHSEARSHTAEDADVAAEVAETAMLLDKGPREPEISDREAGKAGIRRLSSTPVAEISETAAEVADEAAKLDTDAFPSGQYDHDAQCPMFSHECLGTREYHRPEARDDVDRPGQIEHHNKSGADDIDYNDPQLEHFPTDRPSILSTIRRLSSSIDADPTRVDINPIPVVASVSPNRNASTIPRGSDLSDTEDRETEHQDRKGLPESSNSGPTTTSGTSLVSIAEDDESLHENATERLSLKVVPRVTHAGTFENSRSHLDSAISDEDEDEGVFMADTKSPTRTRDSDPENDEQPVILPIDHHTASETDPRDDSKKDSPNGSKTTSASVKASGRNNLQKRHLKGNRPETPGSVHSLHKGDKNGGNWLQAFFRTLFVDWIGGMVMWLCGRRRNRV